MEGVGIPSEADRRQPTGGLLKISIRIKFGILSLVQNLFLSVFHTQKLDLTSILRGDLTLDGRLTMIIFIQY